VNILKDIVNTTGKNLKKNAKRKKEIPLSSDVGDEPCVCGHLRCDHLGSNGELCFGCYTADIMSKKYYHNFKLDNLTYVENLYKQKLVEKFKNES
jgi:hypothetical protein